MEGWIVLAAFGLDLVVGDPQWLPHPIRLIGRTIEMLGRLFRNRYFSWIGERLAGVLLTVTVVGSAYALVSLALAIGGWIHPWVEIMIAVYISFTVLATKSLGDEARGVYHRLRNTDLGAARKCLSRIVGRETGKLSEEGITRATVETVAENSSDGVIASLFYLTIGGPPLAMAYKAVNTLDSMIGYPIPPYRKFGWASARLDDLANYIPARITGFLMVLSAGLLWGRGIKTFKVMRRDGRKHDSPNAGIPEAAAAGALGIQLGGPSRYQGLSKEKPWIGNPDREIKIEDIPAAIKLMRVTAILMLFLCIIVLSASSFKTFIV